FWGLVQRRAQRVHLGARDVGARRADRLGRRRQRARLVDARDLDADRTRCALPLLPLHVDAQLRVGLEPLRTVLRVNRDAPTWGDEARDAPARQRLAALAEADQHVLHARQARAALRLAADEP